MSSRAPNTQGQLAVAVLAQGLNAGLVEAYVDALETCCTVSGFDALAATRAAVGASAGRINGGLHLALWQGYQRASVEPGINAAGRKQQRSGFSGRSSDCAKALAACRDGVGVPPPVTAEIDGKAATLVVCHGRHPLLDDLAAAGEQLGDGSINTGVRHPTNVFLFSGRQHDGDVTSFAVGAFGHFAFAHRVTVKNIEAGAVLQFGLCHFQLLPLISRGAEGKQSASHELNYTHETKERKNFLNLFFVGRGVTAKPSNVELSGHQRPARKDEK